MTNPPIFKFIGNIKMHVEDCIHLSYWRESITGKNAGVIFILKTFFFKTKYILLKKKTIHILEVYKLYLKSMQYVPCTICKSDPQMDTKVLITLKFTSFISSGLSHRFCFVSVVFLLMLVFELSWYFY